MTFMYFSQLESAALDAVLADCKRADPEVRLLALLPEAEHDRLPLLQARCRQAGISVCGGIFPRLVSGGEWLERGSWLLRHEGGMAARLVELDGEPADRAADRVRHAVEPMLARWPESAGKPTLYMLFDGMLPNIASILDELYLLLSDQVAYAGVAAGSETFRAMPCLFDDHRQVGGGVLCLLLPASANPVLRHGYRMPGHLLNATSTAGNRIFQIDWRPAFETYQAMVRHEYGVALDPGNFYEYGAHFPLAMVLACDDVVVRIPVTLEEDGSVACVGEVPENAMLVLLQAPELAESHCVDEIRDALQAGHGNLQGGEMLSFYCAGRRKHFGEAARLVLEKLVAATGVATLAGALSLGEIGSTREWGYPMFHNAAIVCSAWGPP